MTDRIDVTFPSGGDRCAAWLYHPAGDGPHPTVVVGHGFAGVREGRLDAFAERFAEAGMAVLVFDYRHFGASDGQPRQLLDIGKQLDDWRAALSWVRAQPELDSSRLAIWGTSFGGGHVMKIASEDHGLAAAIAQVPFADGLVNGRDVDGAATRRLLGAAIRDRVGALLGRPPRTIPVVGPPGSLAAMTSPDSEPGYMALIPEGGTWRNEVAPRVFLEVARYRPARKAAAIQCPLLVCVATEDVVTPAEPAVEAAHRAPRGEVLSYPCGHFDVYVGEGFEKIVADQVDFLRRHLVDRTDAARAPRARRSWIDDRVVLVTGAARGIGAGLARELVGRGARVALVGLEPERLAALSDELGEAAAWWEADVTNPESMTAAVDGAVEHFGRLDAAIANAGISAAAAVETMEPASFKKVIDVNLFGAWLTLKTALPHVVRRGGYLMSIISTGAFVQSPLQAHYTASKAGLHAATNSLRLELRGTGTSVGAAYMTFIETDMMKDVHADPAGALIWEGNKKGTFGMIRPDEAVRGILAGLEARARQVVVPSKLTLVSYIPGVIQRLTEPKFPVARTRQAVRLADPSGWNVASARERYRIDDAA